MYVSTTASTPGQQQPQCKGMGSVDLSTLTWEDYLLLGMAGMTFFYLMNPDHSIFTSKPTRRKRKSSGSSGVVGTITAAAVVLGIAYAGYQYFTSNTGATG